MPYKSLRDCIIDLERGGHLVRITEEVDPSLEMAAIHLRVFEAQGQAILYENIKGCAFPAVSNLFGTLERSRFMFRNTLDKVKRLIDLKSNPISALRNPFIYLASLNALPMKSSRNPVLRYRSSISRLPQIKCWQKDGGAFILLPQVYTEDPDRQGWMGSNLGCYRIQMSGNEYRINQEVGLHYQIHRGIGVHQSKWNAKSQAMKVSIFVGGPPAHTFAAIMPLPEGMPEVAFAGVLAGRRFRYTKKDGYIISSDVDFVITGEIFPKQNKPEGPFGDHLGYYSLTHDFPVMKVAAVYHRKDAIWPFTVVGRPPQEDTQFGKLIHEITGPVLPREVPGLKQIHAVDAAGVHPLLLAIGSERYTPYLEEKRPQELLTIANRILGTGQLSLAKYLFIAADHDGLNAYDVKSFFKHFLERILWEHDLHFQTNTTIDTLDYSGYGLNSGSKLVLSVAGNKVRDLPNALNAKMRLPGGWENPKIVLPGIISVKAPAYESRSSLEEDMAGISLDGFQLVTVCDNSDFVSESLNNFLWVTFTRSNPATDVYGVGSFTKNKHWGCKGPLVIDARVKPHHAPVLEKDLAIEKKVDRLGEKGHSLHGII